MYRILLEMSSMLNNEEYVLYSSEHLELADYDGSDEWRWKLRSLGVRFQPHDACRLRFSRAVMPLEFEAGLNVNFQGYKHNENVPQITNIIDELTKLLRSLSFHINILGMTPEASINEWIAYNYYDCLSAGTSKWSLAMVRKLIQEYGFSHDADVYPATSERAEKLGRSWCTIGDFLEEIKNIPDIQLSLPSPMNFRALLEENS